VVAQPEQPQALTIHCQECRGSWDDPSERWRLYLTDDDPPLSAMYCPECAEREFGSD
jgi:hypothetical protein